MTYEMDDIQWRCAALSYPGRQGEGGGHLSSRGLCIGQGARVVRMDKKGGVGGEQRVGSPFDKTRWANDIGGRWREPPPTTVSSEAPSCSRG